MTDNFVPLRQAVPARFIVRCELCGHDLDTRAMGVHQWTCGWVMQREGGGGHGISLPVRSNRFACRQCVERVVRGGVGQRDLLT